MSVREILPQRRRAENFAFDHYNPAGNKIGYTATVGYYDDGRVGEVFLNASKLTTDIDVAARDAAIILSFALQHGVTPTEMRASMSRDPEGTPMGVLGTLLDILCTQESDIGLGSHQPEA